ncbi:Wzz/FepE/Etk N-terminal domain-containing protein [Bordetella hinzii]|uniref:GumC family protein n=2 Tax=Bordetella hinzii TaxID=103855 RepID=UPI002A188E0C|nr:Wzz/FepE/Etk N-terminal domain-containing protein [Bordetella hinzii]WPL80035.1 Wzz/FepE/Etk N-terminal domain-containing protein [Bordetella hinzii]
MSPEYSLLSLNQVWAMLAARARLIAWVALGTLLLTCLLILVLPRVWTASSDVFIDYRENDPINGRSFSPLLDESYMQTQIDMIRSQTVADYVIASLGLLSGEEAASGSKARNELVAYIKRNLEVAKQQNSRVLTISFSANTPQKAREFANAVVNSYIAVSQGISSAAARARTEQYTAQLEQLRGELDAIQDKLTRYQQETGIVDTRQTGDDIDVRRLNDMATAMLALESQLEAARARKATTASLLAGGMRPEDLPEVGLIAPINDLRNGLTVVEHQLGQLRGALGPKHPSVAGLLAQRAQMQAEIARQAKAAVEAQDSEVQRLEAQKAALQRDMDAQRAKVLDQMAKRDRIAAYQRQFAGVEQVYQTALQKYDGILMASNISLPSLSVLRAAEVPSSPSRPKVRTSLVLGLLFGIMAGLALALLLELSRRRVRCLDDLERNTSLPVLGRVGRNTVVAAS